MDEPARVTPPHSFGMPDEAELLHALYLAYPDALLLVDDSGRIVRANPAAERLLGYNCNELVSLGVETLLPQALRDGHAAMRAGYLLAPRSRPMGSRADLKAQRKDGSEIAVEIALSPVKSLGRPYVLAAMRDITSFPRALRLLQRTQYSEQLAQLGRVAVDARDPQPVLDQVAAAAAAALNADSTFVFLLDGNLLDFRLSSAAGRVHDVPVGMHLPNTPDSLPGHVLQQGRALHIADLNGETGLTLPDALLDAGLSDVYAVPLSDRGRTIGVFVVGARQPMTLGSDERQFIESLCNLMATSLQRAQSEDALKHAQRLETVGQLTGGIAHDFNNLLTIIQGNLQVLEELPSLADDAQGQQMVATAARAVRRGGELTGKLLAFSRRQVLQPDAIDVGQMVNSLADMLRRTLDQRIRIDVDLPADCPRGLADPGQLEAALLNIAVNARDAMDDGGTLRFRVQACDELPTEVRDGLDDSSDPALDGYVAIAVSDTGSGMTDSVKQRAFEPFFTTKEAGRGTGLGLSTVYGFVKQSSGAVTLDSRPGAGTTLTLYLPRPRPGEPAAAPGDGAAAAVALPAGLRVLLVEDEADVRGVVASFLDALGCRTKATASAGQALLALGEDTDVDLLLTDIALGAGMSGLQLAARLRQRMPTLAVLLMSGYADELLGADREAPSDWELLPKPFTRAELADAIARLLAARNGAA